MEFLRRSLVWLVQVLLRRWFLLFTIYALYVYHMKLDKDMACSCDTLDKDCWVYLLVPGLILFVLQLWVDMVFARGLKVLCGGAQGPVGSSVVPVLVRRVLEAGFVGLLWVQSVLLDGDWYMCCGRINRNCARFIDNQRIPDSSEIRNESYIIGLMLTFIVFLSSAVLSWLPWRRWCSSASCDWPEAVLEEAELTLSQRIRMAAQDQLQMKLDRSGGDWRKFDELERELLQDQAKTPVQTSVVMSSLTNGETG